MVIMFNSLPDCLTNTTIPNSPSFHPCNLENMAKFNGTVLVHLKTKNALVISEHLIFRYTHLR